MTTIISPAASGTDQRAAAAAVPAGTVVRYAYRTRWDGREFVATGAVEYAEGSAVVVRVLAHEEDDFLVGCHMIWLVCHCTVVA